MNLMAVGDSKDKDNNPFYAASGILLGLSSPIAGRALTDLPTIQMQSIKLDTITGFTLPSTMKSHAVIRESPLK